MNRLIPCKANIIKLKTPVTTQKWLLLFLIIFPILYSCKTSRQIAKGPLKEYGADYLFTKLKENELKFDWIEARFNIDLIIDQKKTNFKGQIRMRKDSAIWVSFSPAMGIEMARLLITTDSVKFINRLNKSYFLGDYRVVNNWLKTNVDYDVLQSILLGNDLTYYEDGKFRASYDSKEYHLVTAGRSKLKKYIRTQDDAERIYIQNIYLDPETFKITHLKMKELRKETEKLNANYSDFQLLGDQLFPYMIQYEIMADFEIFVDLNCSRIELDQPQKFPFKISSKYSPMQ
ncbi:MAG: DUF4292 domain-containing protein [Bacteroidales bacterium]|nr:DUF4292 domain-containing protein [Bacteroidales bacterium]MCF8403472.1 DUF4292 domain-containing protein [Bacteroidales bacterium]